MNLKIIIDLLKNLIIEKVIFKTEFDINRIHDNSDNIKKNDIFVALKGDINDGHKYIPLVLKKGASLIIAESKKELQQLSDKINYIIVSDSKKALAILLHYYYEINLNDFKIFGITGTNGKSTTTSIIHHILRESRKSSTLMNTVEVKINDEIIEESKNTTQSIYKNSYYLKESQLKQINYINMEISSHAIQQKRIENIEFDILCFTNITRDHLDYHKNFQEYKKTKISLLKYLKKNGKVIINRDLLDINEFDVDKSKIITIGFDEKSDYIIKNVTKSIYQMNFVVETPEKKEISIYSSIIGNFNAYNITSAIAACKEYGLSYNDIKHGIITFRGVPGRFQMVKSSKALGFSVVVDFAHTPDALEQVLITAKDITKGRVILVFGAGGNADIGKRKIMGDIASKHANILVLTTDDPKDEDEDKIIENVKEGVDENSNLIVVKDRENAINAAINFANRDDIVLITGRGHEDYQLFASGKKIKFNDYDVALNIINSIRKNSKK